MNAFPQTPKNLAEFAIRKMIVALTEEPLQEIAPLALEFVAFLSKYRLKFTKNWQKIDIFLDLGWVDVPAQSLKMWLIFKTRTTHLHTQKRAPPAPILWLETRIFANWDWILILLNWLNLLPELALTLLKLIRPRLMILLSSVEQSQELTVTIFCTL